MRFDDVSARGDADRLALEFAERIAAVRAGTLTGTAAPIPAPVELSELVLRVQDLPAGWVATGSGFMGGWVPNQYHQDFEGPDGGTTMAMSSQVDSGAPFVIPLNSELGSLRVTPALLWGLAEGRRAVGLEPGPAIDTELLPLSVGDETLAFVGEAVGPEGRATLVVVTFRLSTLIGSIIAVGSEVDLDLIERLAGEMVRRFEAALESPAGVAAAEDS